MSWIEVHDYSKAGWVGAEDTNARAVKYCRQLEKGEILFFPETPLSLGAAPKLLTAQRTATSRLHKNISYRPLDDRLGGFEGPSTDTAQMLEALRTYSQQVTQLVSSFLSPYQGKFRLDYASFRPFEEEGRDLPLHKRNDLLHVDAFPSRPTWGGRILRVFTNINADTGRVWLTGLPFPSLAESYAEDADLAKIAAKGSASWSTRLMNKAGLPVPVRSAYDRFMLRFHDYLKENTSFQSSNERQRLDFPPGSTWMVFTDGVPHAALSGKFALEQTFIIPVEGLVAPEDSPLRVLERLSGRRMA